MDGPHVVLLPFPAQGHIKPMLMLAELLCHAGLNITFINTQHNQNLIQQSLFNKEFPNFRFMSIPDGLPPEHPRSGTSVTDLFHSISSVSKPTFKDLIVSFCDDSNNNKGRWKTPTCIIADGIMSFAIDVAEEFNIKMMSFRTYCATSTWLYFHLQKLIQEGEIPLLEGNEDMNRQVSCIPGLENVLRRRDLPNICRFAIDHPSLQFFIDQAEKMKRASALILNTFVDLEAPIIAHLHSIYSTVYTVGPLHTLLRTKSFNSSVGRRSLRQEDKTCMEWLNSQAPNSVIYVSFGSVVVLSRDQVLEFWYGLVNSRVPFLWAIRPDLVLEENGPAGNPEELVRGTNERGWIVSWAPQEEVLAHPAIGGFLTHSGWNSTLECISAGKPMICWPKIAEQAVNSRCASEMWNIGLDMKDTCDRSTVEKMVRDLMDNNNENNKRNKLAKSAERFSLLAHKSVCEEGSSDHNIKKLIQDLRSIHLSTLSS